MMTMESAVRIHQFATEPLLLRLRLELGKLAIDPTPNVLIQPIDALLVSLQA